MNAFTSNFLGVSEARINTKIFHCSDGTSYKKFKSAYRHEMHLRIVDFFPESSFGNSKRYGGKGYYLSRHEYIKCGVYRITLRNPLDLDIMNYFFRGLVDELPELSEDDFPYEFDLDIYYEEYPGILIPKAQWRLYNEDNYR